jgi:hypothetical protein
MEFKFFRGAEFNYVEDLGILWRTSTGRSVSIRNMTITHIQNAVNCLEGRGETIIPDPYLGRSHYEWINIFYFELNLRNAENC